MKANKSSETKPERILRSVLHSAGFRFRKNHPVILENLKVRPDVVFTRQKIAVFVDGCFWHSCPDHGNVPRRNVEYWERKLRRNKGRDNEVTTELRRAGWTVVRIWEHTPISEALALVHNAFRGATDPD